MYVPESFEFELYGAADPGVPNDERIILRPSQAVNLGNFLLGVGIKQTDGMIRPLNDYVFWFPAETVDQRTWVFVYTGVGQRVRTLTQDTHEPALVLHWGRQQTVFASPLIVPFILRKTTAIIGEQI